MKQTAIASKKNSPDPKKVGVRVVNADFDRKEKDFSRKIRTFAVGKVWDESVPVLLPSF